VEPDGQVALGPAYGRTDVKDLTTEQAEARIKRKLREVLRRPEVRVTAAGKVTRWRAAMLPKCPYKIGPGDALLICATDVLPKIPLHEVFVVQPSGTVLLGSKYGEVQVRGLTLEGAEEAVRRRLKEVAHSAEVSTTIALQTGEWTQNLPRHPYRIAPGDLLDIRVANTLTDWPIDGLHVVEPDGQVPLGPAYGRVNLKGLTLQRAEANVDKHLREVLRRPEVLITLWGWQGDEERTRQCPRPAAASASNPSAILPRPPPMCCCPMSCLAPLPPRGVAITPLPVASWPLCDLDALTGTDLDGLRKYWGGDVTLRAGAGPTTAPLPGFRWPPCDLDGRMPLWGAANCPLGLRWRLPADAPSGQR
jgi:protein involved in polysaccharide export with SLBB domain